MTREIHHSSMKRGTAEAYEKAKDFVFRAIRPEETEQAIAIEAVCFPPNEACKREHMIPRIAAASDFFLIAEDPRTGKIAGFINGIATDETAFRDEFFTDAALHDPSGRSIMILGLDVLPEYRGLGLARRLVMRYRQRYPGRRLVLTCLERLVPMYARFGFRDLGLSASVWGGETWHEMDMEPLSSPCRLKMLPEDLTVCKVESMADLPLDRDFFFIGKTDEEISLVCRTEDAPARTLRREDGWRGFRIQGVLDFSLIGILARISGVLAENGIGIFAVSTYNTDYILVKAENFGRAMRALETAGYTPAED